MIKKLTKLTKTLLVAAGLCVGVDGAGAYMTTMTGVLGNTDYSTAYWTAKSKQLTLADGDQYVIAFENHNGQSSDFSHQNWYFELNAGTEFADFPVDGGDPWGDDSFTERTSSTKYTDKFGSISDWNTAYDATVVTLTISRSGNVITAAHTATCNDASRTVYAGTFTTTYTGSESVNVCIVAAGGTYQKITKIKYTNASSQTYTYYDGTSIVLGDEETYTATTYDFKSAASADGVTLLNSNGNYAKVAGNLTSVYTAEYGTQFAFSQLKTIADDNSNYGYCLRYANGKDNQKGLFSFGRERLLTIVGLKSGQVVEVTGAAGCINSSIQGSVTSGAWNTDDSQSGKYNYTMTADGDLNLNSGASSGNYDYIYTITIYRGKSPSYTISGTNGTSRKFTLSCDDANTTKIYYSETEKAIGDEGWTEYTSEVTTSAETIYAYAATAQTTSAVISFATGAGTMVSLNAPTVAINTAVDFTNNGALYYPQYTFTSDQSGILGNPAVTYSYTINGTANAEANPTGYSEAKSGTLVVTASADGYASASTEIEVGQYALKNSWDFSDTDYDLNSNWNLRDNNLSMPGGTYSISGKRYNITNTELDVSATDALFTGLRFSQNYYSLYWYVAGLGVGYSGQSGANTTTITVTGLTSDDYTVYKKYYSGNTEGVVVVAGNNTWTMGKMNGTGAHVLHGIFVYTPISTVPATIGAYGYATYASDYDLDFTGITDLKAYKATISGDEITFTAIDQVPAGEGILLRATNTLSEETPFDIPVTTGVAAWGADENAFVRGSGAAVATRNGGTYNYVLSINSGVVGFYQANGNIVPASKAYLQTTTLGARLALNFNDDITAIKNISPALSEDDNAVYNLSGQRIAAPSKGLYIKNGKKVIMK